MQTHLHDLTPGIARITLTPPNSKIAFTHYVIRGERPALMHMGHAKSFPALRAAVARVIEPSALRFLCFSHVEADESGALNEWLALAPHSEVCVGKVCASGLKDSALRPPRVLAHGEQLDLGGEQLSLIETPHFPHNWDACLFYAHQARVLFGSDLGTQMGTYAGFRDDDPVDEILALDAKLGYLGRGLQRALDRLAALDVEVLACMHGAPLRRAQAARLLTELRALP